MKQNRQKTLAYIDEDEGPEVNISSDEPGGASCRGVSLTVLKEYQNAHTGGVATINDIRNMTTELAGQVYTWAFLDPLLFDQLPSGVDYRMADAAITLGLKGSCIAVQMALSMWPVTGAMDAVTLIAIKNTDPKLVIAALDAAWITWKYCQTSTGWAKYGHGWTNRVVKVRDRALALCATQ